jgi:hypothetical protein
MTRSRDERPTRRLMSNRYGDEYVIELRADTIAIRPKRSRRGGLAEVVVLPGLVYLAAVRKKLEHTAMRRRNSRR